MAKWSSGQTELAVAGFNYGRFKKKVISDKDSGYDVEFYANVEVPDELKEIQNRDRTAESQGAEDHDHARFDLDDGDCRCRSG